MPVEPSSETGMVICASLAIYPRSRTGVLCANQRRNSFSRMPTLPPSSNRSVTSKANSLAAGASHVQWRNFSSSSARVLFFERRAISGSQIAVGRFQRLSMVPSRMSLNDHVFESVGAFDQPEDRAGIGCPQKGDLLFERQAHDDIVLGLNGLDLRKLVWCDKGVLDPARTALVNEPGGGAERDASRRFPFDGGTDEPSSFPVRQRGWSTDAR